MSDSPQAHATATSARTWVERGLRLVWWINLAALVGVSAWAYFDARFIQTAYSLKTQLGSFLAGQTAEIGHSPLLVQRLNLLLALMAAAAASGVVLFAALFVGPRSHRRLSSWLMFTGLTAAWLALWVNWPDVSWLGQKRRLSADLSGFEAVAHSLRAEFPTADGDRPGLGPFMGYPIGKPSMILLLTTPQVSQSGIAVVAVERSPDRGLCFQLGGTETGGWLEWHPPGSKPASFVGGLMSPYDLIRSSPLSGGWWLVRYREPAARASLD